MDFDAALDKALNRLHEEGRYRTFIDIERKKGHFPHAVWTRPDGRETPITVWCGNDYLGMGQHPAVLAAMHEALEATGAGSAARATSRAPRSITSGWRPSLPTARQGSGAGLFVGLHRQ